MKEISKIFRKKRESLNLSVAEAAKKTGIRPSIIENIESGIIPDMPAVYVKSFIKKYALLLGIEKEEYQSFLAELDNKSKEEQKSYRQVSSDNIGSVDPSDKNFFQIIKKGNIKELFSDSRLVSSMLYLAVALALSALVYIIFFSDEDTSTDEEIVEINQANRPEDNGEDDGLLNYFESNDSLVLEAFALDSGWISITIDGKKKDEVLMPPGMTKVWKAKEFFIVTEGNSGAIKFTRNGETLEPFGSRGKVVTNVKITEDNIEK